MFFYNLKYEIFQLLTAFNSESINYKGINLESIHYKGINYKII